MENWTKQPARIFARIAFLFLLCGIGWNSYCNSTYNIDMLGYMGNLVALETTDVNEIHRTVYDEVRSKLPAGARDHLLGLDPGPVTPQILSLRDRAADPRHFAEFLPCFAIRPLYIEMLHIFHRLGVGLISATILGSVLPYIALGVLIFAWSERYVGTVYASVLVSLLLLMPPIWDLSRMREPDCLSALWVCLALFLVFEQERFVPGLIFLMSSVYVRTDNVLLVLSVLAYHCLATKQLDRWKATVLALVAMASVHTINHFAGDYGWRLLYYRGFIEPPLAPGEFVAHFTRADYDRALRSGITVLIHGDFIPFLLLGVIGWIAARKRKMASVFSIVTAFSALHFVIFPLAENRYLAAFYAFSALTAIAGLASTICTTTAQAFGKESDIELPMVPN